MKVTELYFRLRWRRLMLRFNLAKGGYSMRVRPSGIQWMKKEKLLLILLLALIIAASSPVQGESWKDAAKKAAVDYGSLW
jgi:hypothetical protein